MAFFVQFPAFHTEQLKFNPVGVGESKFPRRGSTALRFFPQNSLDYRRQGIYQYGFFGLIGQVHDHLLPLIGEVVEVVAFGEYRVGLAVGGAELEFRLHDRLIIDVRIGCGSANKGCVRYFTPDQDKITPESRENTG